MDSVIGMLLMIVGIGMITFWVLHIMSGKMTQGIMTLENGGFIAFHITAELITGIFCILGGLGVALSWNSGYFIPVFACGMLAYTSLNSLAWSEIRNKPVLSAMFIVPLLIAIGSGIYLTRYL